MATDDPADPLAEIARQFGRRVDETRSMLAQVASRRCEYQFVVLDSPARTLAALNVLGAEQWEAVAVCPFPNPRVLLRRYIEAKGG